MSVVLPTFNRLRYLRAAIDSVFAQTFTDWELIVADDGSEGETADYVAALADPPRVKVLRLAHTGNPGAVRNAALQAARGEYIAFLDSDDVWLPSKLALQVASLRSHPERGWSHTAFAVIDDSGELLRGAHSRWWPAAEGWILEHLIDMKVVIAIASVMVKRSLLEQLGGFDPEQLACNDYDLWLRLAGLTEIDGVPETLVYKRMHNEPYYQSTVMFEDLGRALAKLFDAGIDPSLYSTLRRGRTKVATGLARSQVVCGSRRAALRTLVESSPYAWRYPEWWLGGAEIAARAVTPKSIVRIARDAIGRVRG